MADKFAKFKPVLESVAHDAFNVVPSNTALSQTTRSIFIGTTGDVCVQMLGYDNSNTIITFANVPAGAILPIRVTKVFANTTANNIVGLF